MASSGSAAGPLIGIGILAILGGILAATQKGEAKEPPPPPAPPVPPSSPQPMTMQAARTSGRPSDCPQGWSADVPLGWAPAAAQAYVQRMLAEPTTRAELEAAPIGATLYARISGVLYRYTVGRGGSLYVASCG